MLRLAFFIAVAMMVGVVTLVIVALREQVLKLVMRLGELATEDFLTRALNRGAFERRLESELARSERVASPCSLVVLDIDHFKAINDSFGHQAGDQALRRLAGVVQAAKRRSDVFGRIGGEEFALLLPDTDIDGAAILAEKLRRRLAISVDGARNLTVSFGIADVETGGRTIRGMLHTADRALYAAKRAGRDRVVRADELEDAGRQGLAVAG